MPIGLIGGAISGGASLLSGILGSNAASKAAAEQAAAGRAAAGQQAEAGQQAQGYLTSQLANANTNSQPFVSTGQNAVNSLNNALAPGGALTQGFAAQNGTFQAPTAAQAAATPGYQFQLDQGLAALQNSAAARGGLLSTGTAKNLENYAQGLASTNYQQVYNNALQAYNTNFGVYNTTQQNLYNNLLGVSSLGANSAANLNSVNAGTTNSLANNITGNQQIVGNDLLGSATALAGGTIGSANALNSGIGGAANSLGSGITLSQILGAHNASNSGRSPNLNNALPVDPQTGMVVE
jgi:hypothetical protein